MDGAILPVRYARPMTRNLDPDFLELIAARFKLLSEPARLHILNALKGRELSVGELVDETGLGQANVSKHLQLLLANGFVKRRRDGLFAYYSLADRDVLRLCDIMCSRLDSEVDARRRLVSAR